MKALTNKSKNSNRVMSKKKNILNILLVILGLTATTSSFSQCDTIASICGKNLTAQFVSDGQQYRALLLNDQIAEFHTTFYGGSTYRVAACSGLSDGNLVFTIKDTENNILFTNADYKNSSYWDFKVNSTIDCIIEARLNAENAASGCAVLLIGFKQQQ